MHHAPPHDPWYRHDEYGQHLPQSVVNAISSSAIERSWELLRACIMAFAYERDRYTGLDMTGAPGAGTGGLLNSLHYDSRIMDNRSTPWINKIKSVVDVVTDKVLQGLPSLAVRSSNAKFEDLRLHDIRSRALNAVMQDPRSRRELYMWTRDGIIKRVGFCRPLYRHGRLDLQRLHPWQVFWDAQDALSGEISQVHTVQLVDRTEWLGWYRQTMSANKKGVAIKIPQHDTRIMEIEQLPAAQAFLPGVSGFSGAWMGAHRWLLDGVNTLIADQIRVVWSYKRSWMAGDPTGRVVCTVLSDNVRQSVVALDMPFARSSLPVVHWSPWRADVGITGISLAEQLIGAQQCIDQFLFKMTRLLQKYGHPKVFLERGTVKDTAVKALLSAGVEVVEVEGPNIPQMVDGLTLNASDVSFLQFLLDRPASEQGVTPLLTQGQSQLGPSASGVARLEERFSALDRQQGVRDAHTWGYLSLGTEVLNTIQDAILTDKGFRARWPTKVAGQFRERPWAELQLSDGDTWLGIAERGVLGTTRAGQIQKSLELHAQGLINTDSVREVLFSTPDLDAVAQREIAPRRAIEAQLDVLLDPEATEDEIAEIQPTEDMDLEDAAYLTTALINQAIAHDASAETLVRLRGYLQAISATRTAMQTTQAPAMTAPTVAAIGMPPSV